MVGSDLKRQLMLRTGGRDAGPVLGPGAHAARRVGVRCHLHGYHAQRGCKDNESWRGTADYDESQSNPGVKHVGNIVWAEAHMYGT